jgi:Ca-activated chloride channel family protein
MRFHDPQFLLLLILLVPLAILIRRHTAQSPSLPVADERLFLRLPETFRSRAARLLSWFWLPLLTLLILALARPQSVARETTLIKKAADLMIALDLSTSMLAEDSGQNGSHKNRLAVAKDALTDFLVKRSGDRIGVIAFAARPYPAAPLTLDHAWLKEAVGRLQVGAVEDGTALGDALLAALNRLRNKPAGTGAVILITDGRNNSGSKPEQASAVALAMGIRVHTVGIGSVGSAIFPTEDLLGGISYRQMEADLDEATLRSIAASTGGKYFRGDNQNGMEQIFSAIDILEKSPVEQKIFFSYRELFPFYVMAALILFLIVRLLDLTLLRRIN